MIIVVQLIRLRITKFILTISTEIFNQTDQVSLFFYLVRGYSFIKISNFLCMVVFLVQTPELWALLYAQSAYTKLKYTIVKTLRS